MLLDILGVGLLVDLLTGKAKTPGRGLMRAGEGTIRTGQDF